MRKNHEEPTGQVSGTGQPQRPRGSAATRLGWIDTAKGIAMLLVVAQHALGGLSDHALQVASMGWWRFNEFALSFRMPGFFLVSGLFLYRWHTRRFDSFLDRRVWPYLWVYIVWSLLFVLIPLLQGLLVSSVDTGSAVLAWLEQVAVVNTGMWYLATLPLYCLTWWATRKVPLLPLLLAAGALSIAVGVQPEGAIFPFSTWERTLQYLVFFLIGARASGHVRDIADLVVTKWWAALAGLAAVGLTWWGFELTYGDADRLWFRLGLLPFVAVPAFLSVARWVDASPLGYITRAVGSRTLPIYVMHTAWLYIFYLVMLRITVPASAWTLPVIVTVATLFCLGTWLLTRRIPGLYWMPDRFARSQRKA